GRRYAAGAATYSMRTTRLNRPPSVLSTRSGRNRRRVNCRKMAGPVPADVAAGGESFDEMLVAPERPRRPYRRIHARLQTLGHAELRRRQRRAPAAFRDMGITFPVYQAARGLAT